MKKEDTNTNQDQQSEASEDEELAVRLAELQEMQGVTTTDNPDGSTKISINLSAVQTFLAANGSDTSQDEIADDLIRQVVNIANSLETINFLAVYLVVKKVESETIMFTTREQVMDLFEEQGFEFRESIIDSIYDPDYNDDDEPETAEEIVHTKQKFAEFVGSISPDTYQKLHQLYASYNQAIKERVAEYSSFRDFINNNNPQIQVFLKALRDCFSDPQPLAAQEYFVSAEETDEGRSVTVPAKEEEENPKATETEEEFELTDYLIQILEKFLEHLRQLDLGAQSTSLAFSSNREQPGDDNPDEPGSKKRARHGPA